MQSVESAQSVVAFADHITTVLTIDDRTVQIGSLQLALSDA